MTALRTLLGSSFVVIAGALALLSATDDFQAFTTETARRLEVLRHPPGVPPVALQTQAGTHINLADLRGQWLLVDFIYTRCPSYCVALGSEFAQLQRALSAPIAARKLILLSVSFDPAHDTPERLAAYQLRSRSYDPGWILARPLTVDGLDQLLQIFGVTVVEDGSGGYTHNAAIAVVDPQGRLVRIMDQGDPGAVERVMRRNLGENQNDIATRPVLQAETRRHRIGAQLAWLWQRRSVSGLALFVILLLPPVRHALEAQMTLQMLVQLPLLVLVGWCWAAALPIPMRYFIGTCNHHGITGLLLASLAAAYWMLPKSMDAAVSQPWMDVAKYASVPLLIGLPFALSWPQMDFVVRGVFLLEFIASFFRLGWLYLASPVRLCSNYLISDQQYLGRAMLVIGIVLTVWMSWKLLWGRFDSADADS